MFEWINIRNLGPTELFEDKFSNNLIPDGWYPKTIGKRVVPKPKYKLEDVVGRYLTLAGNSVTGMVYFESALGLQTQPQGYPEFCQALIDLQSNLELDLFAHCEIIGIGLAWRIPTVIRPELLFEFFGTRSRWRKHRINGDRGTHLEYHADLYRRNLSLKDITPRWPPNRQYRVLVLMEQGNGAKRLGPEPPERLLSDKDSRLFQFKKYLAYADLFEPETYKHLAKWMHDEYLKISKVPERFFDIERLPNMPGDLEAYWASAFFSEIIPTELLDELIVAARQRGEIRGALGDFRKKFAKINAELFKIGSFRDAEVRLVFDEQVAAEYMRQCATANEEAPRIATTTLPSF